MQNYEIAIYGLGVMGSSLAKNLLNKEFCAALYGKETEERKSFRYSGHNRNWKIFENKKELIENLVSPCTIFLMITAGDAVDIVIETLLPFFEKG